MKIFLAGALGVIGRRLTPLLLQAGHQVTGTTRTAARAAELKKAGVTPAVLDVYDTPAVVAAMRAAAPEIVIHQLTDLPDDAAELAGALGRNARIRIEGTRNLIAGAQAAGARRLVVQSIAFVYAPGGEPHAETDSLDPDPARAETVEAVARMEEMALTAPGMGAVVLRYGMLYGPGTWSPDGPTRKPALHLDAAAQAAWLAVTKGNGIYNLADDDGEVRSDKARRELGFDPMFRLT